MKETHFFQWTEEVAMFFRFKHHFLVPVFTLYCFPSSDDDITFVHCYPQLDTMIEDQEKGRPYFKVVKLQAAYGFKIKNR